MKIQYSLWLTCITDVLSWRNAEQKKRYQRHFHNLKEYANQNFSQVVKRVDKDGSAIIMKNNKQRYLLVPFQQAEREQNEEDDVFEITQRLLKKNQVVYNELKKKDSWVFKVQLSFFKFIAAAVHIQ